MRLNLSEHTLPSGDPALSDQISEAVDLLKAKLCAEHQPANQTEQILVEEMAEQFWRLRRARAMEASLLDSDKVLIPHLAVIQRMMSSAERGFHKALRVLRELQKDRGSRSESASAPGLVPANPISEPLPCAPEHARFSAQGSGASGSIPQSDQNRDLACQGTPALAREGAANSALGFVPPPCPKNKDIDPADWARAFEARHRTHAKSRS